MVTDKHNTDHCLQAITDVDGPLLAPLEDLFRGSCIKEESKPLDPIDAEVAVLVIKGSI